MATSVMILSVLADKVWIRLILSGYFPRRKSLVVVVSSTSFIGFAFVGDTEVLILEGRIKWRL